MPGPTPLHDALGRAATSLTAIDPFPFTSNAFAALQTTVSDFITEIIEESWRIAKRHKSEVVSARYVEAASTYLSASRARRVFRHLGTVGGILLGGSLSNVLAMLQTNQPFPAIATLVSVGIGLLGSFLVALHMAKE